MKTYPQVQTYEKPRKKTSLMTGGNRDFKRGFSLIITITLMVLLALIAVGLLSLSSIVLRSAASDGEMLQARANARLALQIALGELQATMGPDTRVSANGSILSNRQTISPNMNQVTGVWNAWKPDSNNIGDYEAKKAGPPLNQPTGRGQVTRPDGGFYRWLVSSQQDNLAREVGFAAAGPAGSLVTLLQPLGNQAGGAPVQASRVTLTDATGQPNGQFAWAVLDEGQKAAANGIAPLNNIFSPLETLATQSEISWNNVEEWSGISALTPQERQKLITLETMAFGSVNNPEIFSNDLTPFSSAVMSDTSQGGMKTDLSLLFANEQLPAEFVNRFLYSDEDAPLIPAPNRNGHPYQFPSPDPKWAALHKFHRIPQDLFGGNSANPRLTFRPTNQERTSSIPHRPNGFTGSEAYYDDLKISPVISKAQFYFSLTFARGSATARDFWFRDGGQAQSQWVTEAFMIIDPVITLWNPYDVPMDVSEFRVFLYRIPIAFQFTSTNRRVVPSGEYTEFVMAIAPSANINRNFAYPLSIEPEQGESFELLPGEHRVFSAQTYQTSFDVGTANAAGRAIVMRPGWYPPATRGRDARNIGGVSTENLFRDTAGRATAQFRSRTGQLFETESLPVANGDQISVSVRPSLAEIGNFETVGGRAIDFYLRYGAPAANSQIQSGSEQRNLPDFGAIELDYGRRINSILDNYQGGADIPNFPIDPSDISTAPMTAIHTARDRAGQAYGTYLKKPFLVATLHLKSLIEEDFRSKGPTKAWIHNNPTAIYASAGAGDQLEDLAAQQYEFSYQPLQGDWNNGVPEIFGDRHNGFGGPSPSSDGGRMFAPFVSLPRVTPTSLAQFRHAPINNSGMQPLTAQVISNSFAHPLLPPDAVVVPANSYLDHSFLANQALFDSTFFSTASSAGALSNFLQNPEGSPLINSRFRSAAGLSDNEALQDFATQPQPYEESASLLMMDGAFNINSTSVNAWRAFLTGMNGSSIPLITALTETELGELPNPGNQAVASRYLVPIEESLGQNLDAFGGGEDRRAWTGNRQLEPAEIQALATAIVEEVQLRGPFQSLAEFVNRRAEASDLSAVGALQAAIDNSGLNNEALSDRTIQIGANSLGQGSTQNPAAAEGSALVGTPGYLTQGDLLQALAPCITPRSDTFRIRSYGSTTDRQGRVVAEAWCEAVVQRIPEYVDAAANEPSDHPSRDPDNADFQLSVVNERFGRRFRIVSFRWLNEAETANL